MNFKTTYSPIGANANFSLGMAGETGGFALNQHKLAQQDVYIGYKEENTIYCLPFNQLSDDAMKSFVKKDTSGRKLKLHQFAENEIQRNQELATDTFQAGRLTLEIITSCSVIDNPEHCPNSIIKSQIVPSISIRLSIDNTKCSNEIIAFLGVGEINGKYILNNVTNNDLIGVASIDGYGIASLPQEGAKTFGDFSIIDLFERPEIIEFQLAPVGGITYTVPPNSKKSFDIALGWYQGGIATAGHKKCKYYYTNFFSNLEDVLQYTLDNRKTIYTSAQNRNQTLNSFSGSEYRKFLYTQSVHAYYASTMLFDHGGKPLWVVNEGSFMMLNTFDLTVDHLFYELSKNPWVVKNQLDVFALDYSYYDTTHSIDDPEANHPGGISFTHDQGAMNVYSPKGYSSYEVKNQEGCWSYMTQEQLCNFIICASLYIKTTDDLEWLNSKKTIIFDCLTSMLNRDHYNPNLRDGIMDFDSNRCGHSSEITTYDSIDHSLGQARRNLYLGVKCFASYISLEFLFNKLGSEFDRQRKESLQSAHLCAETIASYYDKNLGYIPSVLDENDKTAIIPAIEGLVYPYFLGMDEYLSESGPFGGLITVLKKHSNTILFEKKNCLFDDMGWKISESSDNSWMSKIFLNQFVAETVLKLDFKGKEELYDKAHAMWWVNGCPTNPGIDQIFSGTQAERNFHYPRAITSYLFTIKSNKL